MRTQHETVGITIIKLSITFALAFAVVLVGCYKAAVTIYHFLKANEVTKPYMDTVDDLAEAVIEEKLEQISKAVTVAAHITSEGIKAVDQAVIIVNKGFKTYYMLQRKVRPAIAAIRAAKTVLAARYI